MRNASATEIRYINGDDGVFMAGMGIEASTTIAKIHMEVRVATNLASGELS